MSKGPHIFAPTSFAAALSAATARPVILKSVPKAAHDGKPLKIETSVPGAFGREKRERLLAAVAAFNA